MKPLRGDLQKPENNDDCRALAPFVMSLFDGEASEFEARRARAHLLVCQTCARRWLDWNRSRDLLCGAPVPAPPPQLLWRVLMACRLAAQPTPQKQRVPANFSAQILARTTRLTTASATASATAPVQAPRRVFSPLRISAWAAPALAAWLMVLQRDVWLPAPVSPPLSRAVAARQSPVSAPKTPVSVRVVKARQMARASNRFIVASLTVRPASAAPIRSVARPRAAQNPIEIENPIESQSENPVELTDEPTTFGAAAQSSVTDWKSSDEFRVEREPQVAAPSEFSPRSPVETRLAALDFDATSPAPRFASIGRLAVLSSSQIAPRLRAARWQSAPFDRPVPAAPRFENERFAAENDSDSASGPQTLRVSLPSSTALQPARRPAENSAENSEGDDERIAEFRSVVEDFRATLSPNDSATSEAGDWESAR